MKTKTKSTIFNQWVFDSIDTFDGYSIYWLHKEDEKTIDPDNLYSDKYSFLDECEQIVLLGQKFINYVVDEDLIEEWEQVRDEEEEEEIEDYY